MTSLKLTVIDRDTMGICKSSNFETTLANLKPDEEAFFEYLNELFFIYCDKVLSMFFLKIVEPRDKVWTTHSNEINFNYSGKIDDSSVFDICDKIIVRKVHDL